MSVWKKLVTALKGGANEAAEAVADNQHYVFLIKKSVKQN